MAKRGDGIEPLEKGRCSRWRVRWDDPIASRQTGKRVYLSKTIHGTKKDAQKFLRKQRDLIDKGRSTKSSKLTVWEWLDAWLKEKEGANSVRPRTIADYRENLERYVSRYPFGALRLSRVTEGDVAAYYEALQGAVSADAVRRVHVILRGAFKRALKRGLIAMNPTDDVELPRTTPTQRTPLTEEQTGKLLATAWTQVAVHRKEALEQRAEAEILRAQAAKARAAHNEKSAEVAERRAAERERAAANADRLGAIEVMYFALWTLLFSTGMRPSEALALTWDDVGEREVKILRSLDKLGNVNEPKSKRGQRTVLLHGTAIDALKKHREVQTAAIEARRAKGREYEAKGRVFATQEGEFLSWTNVRNQRWNPLVEASGVAAEREKAGVERAVPYVARHTQATRLREQGVSETAIADRLGHRPQMTLDSYIHVTDTMREQALTAGAGLGVVRPPMPTLAS